MLKRVLKPIAVPLTILAFVAHSALAGPKRRSRLVSAYARALLFLLGIHVRRIYRTRPPRDESSCLIVCNHLSYVDIMVIAAEYPCLFVTSVEIRETPGLGLIARLAGSLFVERRNRLRIGEELGEISHALARGESVVLFPESTSSNGEMVLPFKRSLLQSAVQARRPILLTSLNYVEIDGKPFGPANRDRVCYYGDLQFFPHFMGLLRTKSIVAELKTLEVIEPSPEIHSKVALADYAHLKVSAGYQDSMPEYQSSMA